jgi:hypothetical protein
VLFYDQDTGALIYTLGITGISLNARVIPQLSITQTGDVMFCAHENFPTLMIRRTGASTFAQETYAFEAPAGAYDNGVGASASTCPFIKFADAEVTLAVDNHIAISSTTTGFAIATTNPPAFETRHVGRRIRYRGKQMYVRSLIGGPLEPVATADVTILEDLDRGAVLTADPTVATAGIIDQAADFEVGEIIVGRTSGIKAEVTETSNVSIAVSMIAGVFPAATTEQIEGLSSGNIVTLIGNTNVNPVPSADWDEEAFTPTNGYPSIVEFHSQRLWFAGSSSLPAHIFGSRVAAFFNFDVGDAFPADSIQAVISDKQVNQITDVVSGRHLQVFTDAGEFYAPQSEDLPIEPETFDLRKQTRFGTKRYQEPKVFDESTIYVQAQGNAVREFIWIDSLRGYSSDAISLISEEYINDVQEFEVLYGGYDRPEQICFFVNGDGTIVWYHAARAEKIRTWGTWSTQGSYKSLTAMQDRLYALVERTIDGVTSIMLERFELYMTVDSGITKVSAGLTPVTGFTAHALHLKNTEVDVVVAVDADGAGDVGGPGVSDQELDADYYLGTITIGATGDSELAGVIAVDPVTNMTVGLAYTSTLEIMPIEVKDNQGVSGGMPKRIVQADIYLASTLAVQLQGNRILTFLGEIDLAIRPQAITGPRKFYLLGYSERPTLVIENDIPLPCEALALGAEVEY